MAAHHHQRGEAKEAAAGGGAGRTRPAAAAAHVALEGEEEPRAAWWAAAAGVAGAGLAGAGVLVWWAVAFHPAHKQLWMVPVGLVLLGTPLVAWLSMFASGACLWLTLVGRIRADPPPGTAVVPGP